MIQDRQNKLWNELSVEAQLYIQARYRETIGAGAVKWEYENLFGLQNLTE